jgi:ribose transport system ATP-binding protein
MPTTDDRRVEPVASRGGAALLQLRGVAKRFPNGTEALRSIDFSVARGSVHGLVGANGAGKSTAIKIASGVLAPTAGRVLWEGRDTDWRRPADASDAGVATVHQHVPLIPTLSVLENVFLSRTGRWRRRAPLEAELDELLDRVDYHLDPRVLVRDLPIGQRQMVAILQALATGARLIIMDEPTASLAVEERQLVYGAVRRLGAQGTAVLYISHFLDEILALTDHVTVLRDGRVVADSPTSAWDEDRLVTAIVGGRLAAAERAVEAASHAGRVVLHADAIQIFPSSAPIDLRLREGEVVGLAGLLGSGRSELLHTLFRDGNTSGTVTVEGRSLGRGARAAASAGVALVPEDRAAQGLMPQWEIWRNVTLPALSQFSRFGLLDRRRERERGQQALRELGVVAPDEEVAVGDLSGGNAQKVLFAKWVLDQPSVLLLDEPMAGIDVGAKRDLFDVVRRLAAGGTSVLIASSDFEELLAVCSRILILHRGQIAAERAAAGTSAQELVALASGLSGLTPSLDLGAVP